MPSAHIVLGHPHTDSFNGHLARTARDALALQGWDVTLSDLAAMRFDPTEGPHHYPHRDPAAEYNVQREQRLAFESGLLPADVREEAERVEKADLLVLQFPLWWYGAPAILKGWFDRVFVYGKMYTGSLRHDRGMRRGQRAMLSVTCGGPEETFAYNGRNGDISLTLWPFNFSLSYIGFTVLEPLVFYGVQAEMRNRPESELAALLQSQVEATRNRMLTLDATPALRFNGWDDWEGGRLKPGVAGHSLMMRAEP